MDYSINTGNDVFDKDINVSEVSEDDSDAPQIEKSNNIDKNIDKA